LPKYLSMSSPQSYSKLFPEAFTPLPKADVECCRASKQDIGMENRAYPERVAES
jgi:hypothetical protein